MNATDCKDCDHRWDGHDFLGCHEEGCICGEEPPQ